MDCTNMRIRLVNIWKYCTYSTICRLFVFIIYILIPVVLKLFPSLFLQSVFSYKSKGHPTTLRLSNPERDHDLPGATNHHISSQSGNEIGIWHIPPVGHENQSLDKADKVIVYCHGKAGTRGSGHRTFFYKRLSGLGFHVVAFDYSGFGDSTGIPNGNTVKLDTISVYAWTLKQLQKPDAIIIVWGHSLGSAIVSYTFAELSKNEIIKPPHGVILESPFTSLLEASESNGAFRTFNAIYPFVWRWLFISSAKYHKMEFETINNLPKIRTNVLMLHAEDDPKINIKLTQKVYDNLATNPKNQAKSVQFYKLSSQYLLGHNLVYSFDHLDEILMNFMNILKKKYVEERLQQFTV